MQRTRVKFCGITNAEDARHAAHLGADAIGLVFYPFAATTVDVATAADIVRTLPPFVTVVALFVNAEPATVQAVVDNVRPSLLQFHGDENADDCTVWEVPYIKACRVQNAATIEETLCHHSQAQAILLDAAVHGQYGGSGTSFDWKFIPQKTAIPIIVAGGLSATNIGGLVRNHRPWAVDVSSGIAEDDNKRRKNWDKMRKFMKEITDADT
ncbi:phosphoribosylanthranilate isomerase [Candidatus Persebacteraceae bacterium Df01]|jgi:phosphoribosylanthranilate isomerase|uniref:N-(5'-phosphoribosyl)anthranilate isomerase n=1 Tax=Candidatus Doriopsillibacter californiensis TaxID=2970740 RepID=A0ABT7QM57_9GAMM|nr:phosphoribosylanthranilate isomerase [Candidatus Persebacteraceae bacterium Df01]